MAIDPFSRRRLTPDEWRAKALRIQSELDELTIDELCVAVGRPATRAVMTEVAVVADTIRINRAFQPATAMAGSGPTMMAT
jgi:hypothetical protein